MLAYKPSVVVLKGRAPAQHACRWQVCVRLSDTLVINENGTSLFTCSNPHWILKACPPPHPPCNTHIITDPAVEHTGSPETQQIALLPCYAPCFRHCSLVFSRNGMFENPITIVTCLALSAGAEHRGHPPDLRMHAHWKKPEQ